MSLTAQLVEQLVTRPFQRNKLNGASHRKSVDASRAIARQKIGFLTYQAYFRLTL